MTASGELAGCICCLGAGRDSHTFEPGGLGGALPGTLGEPCRALWGKLLPCKGHLYLRPGLGGRRRGQLGPGLGLWGFWPPRGEECGWHGSVAGWRVK